MLLPSLTLSDILPDTNNLTGDNEQLLLPSLTLSDILPDTNNPIGGNK